MFRVLGGKHNVSHVGGDRAKIHWGQPNETMCEGVAVAPVAYSRNTTVFCEMRTHQRFGGEGGNGNSLAEEGAAGLCFSHLLVALLLRTLHVQNRAKDLNQRSAFEC
jgi:hypothetical protein